MLETRHSLCLVFALAGCASPSPPMVWDKPGGSQAEYNKDAYECEKDLRQSGYFGNGGGYGLAGAIAEAQRNENMKSFFQRCMVGRGYALQGGGRGVNANESCGADQRKLSNGHWVCP